MIGTTLGHYRITERLGEGGMGEVFRANDELLDRDVALKMLRPELAHRADVADRFRAEAVTLAKLDHRSIARLHGMGKEGAHLFMVMEFVPGETLAARIERGGSSRGAGDVQVGANIHWREVVRIVADMLDGLAYAHAQGVVHRDVKPANVIVRPDGAVKITDFGIARVLGTSRATRTGFIVGTLEYMAPEQIRGEDVDARTDVYAAGIVLYQLLTGRAPFTATTEFELMRQQLEVDAPPIHPLAGDAPVWLDALIARALAKSASDRFQSAAEFRDELLARAEAESPIKATRLAPAPVPATRLIDDTRSLLSRAKYHSRSHLRVAAMAVVIVVVIVSAAAFGWRAMHKSPPTPAPPVAAAGEKIDRDSFPVASESPAPFVPPSRPAPPVVIGTPGLRAKLTAPDTATPPLATPPAVAPPAATAPGVAPAPAPEPARSSARTDAYFDEEALLEIVGGKAHQRNVTLRFVGARIDLLDRKTRVQIKTVALRSIESAVYSRSKQPRWKTASAGVVLGGVFAAPLFFLKGTQHWLTLEGHGDPVVVRLDKDSWERVIAEVEARTNLKVTHATDER